MARVDWTVQLALCYTQTPEVPCTGVGTHLFLYTAAEGWHATLLAIMGQAGHAHRAQGCSGHAQSRARRRKDAVCFSIFSPPHPTGPPHSLHPPA